MRQQIIECVANFSEGRDLGIIDLLVESIERGPGVAVLHRTSDPDHNRSVITFAGPPGLVSAAAVRAVSKAAELIDLTCHAGAHPRIGAADVIPFVPIQGVTLPDCAKLAWDTGEEIWKSSRVPVYFYEAAARVPGRVRLEQIRAGGFEALCRAALEDPRRRPDVGGPGLHPTAGAVAVGARKVLIAWNVNLDSENLAAAQAIARKIRHSSGGFPHVKALGLALPSRRQTQVSMNLTDFEVTPPHVVFEAIRAEAAVRNVEIAGSEIIGLFPRAAIERAAEFSLHFENFRPDLVLESRIEQALPARIQDLLDDLADPSRSTGGGAAAAMAGAMAAALGALTCRLIRRDATPFLDHQVAFTRAAEEDALAFARLMKAAEPPLEDLESAIEAPLAAAERARSLAAELGELIGNCPERYVSDVTTAAGLASAAIAGSIETVKTNLRRLLGSGRAADFERRLRALNW